MIFFAPIEKNLNDINTLKQDYKRYYETEAIQCFKNIQQFMPDAKIVCMQVTFDKISQETIDELDSMRVKFIFNPQQETKTYDNGYWNIPLVGKLIEELYPKEKLIKIDLDMFMLKAIPKELLKEDLLIGRYDDISKKHNLNAFNFPEHYGNPFDTGFIISNSSDYFYYEFYETLFNLTAFYKSHPKMFYDTYKIRLYPDFEDGMDFGVLEEFAISVLQFKMEIKSVYNYNIGEFYKELKHYTDDEIPNILFSHFHFVENKIPIDYVRTKIEYHKRAAAVKASNNMCN